MVSLDIHQGAASSSAGGEEGSRGGGGGSGKQLAVWSSKSPHRELWEKTGSSGNGSTHWQAPYPLIYIGRPGMLATEWPPLMRGSGSRQRPGGLSCGDSRGMKSGGFSCFYIFSHTWFGNATEVNSWRYMNYTWFSCPYACVSDCVSVYLFFFQKIKHTITSI